MRTRNHTEIEWRCRVRWASHKLNDILQQRQQSADDAVLDSEGEIDRHPPNTPMRCLEVRVKLSAFEMDTLWLLGVTELDGQLSEALGMVTRGAGRMNLALLTRLMGKERTSIADYERLTLLGLVEHDGSEGTTCSQRTIRASDRVLELIDGKMRLDPCVPGRLVQSTDLVGPHQNSNESVIQRLQRVLTEGSSCMSLVLGQSSARTRLSCVELASARTERPILVVNSDGLPQELGSLRKAVAKIAREALIHDAIPVFVDLDDASISMKCIEEALYTAYSGPSLATAREVPSGVARIPTLFHVTAPDVNERTQLWRAAFPGIDDELLQYCAKRYAIDADQVADISSTLRITGTTADLPVIHEILRAKLEAPLKNLATRVETSQTWNDVVMPREQFELLAELVARVKHRDLVLDTWGFKRKVGRGTGLAALFSGPPGTGKTMVAGLVAKELQLDLYQVDLSKIVSKYIGETEKQLGALFDAAEATGAVLLFDEADSLFGKRTEVRTANDRFANLEVNYLLQRLESFAGISILTTNHETAIDAAFMRRLAMHVRIPMPEREQRKALWKVMIPEEAPVRGEIDFDRLAESFVMSGGYIKNAVLRAAYLAADLDEPMGWPHLWRGATAEYESMGKVTQRRAA